MSNYGKYRARVEDLDDPERRGRIRVNCPKLMGNSLSAWCLPNVHSAEDNSGDLCLPSIGETVWIEFEQGDINKPIYSGGWFATDKTPFIDYQDAKSHRIITYKGSKIDMTDSDIKITNGSAEITISNSGVAINVGGHVLNLTASKIDRLNSV